MALIVQTQYQALVTITNQSRSRTGQLVPAILWVFLSGDVAGTPVFFEPPAWRESSFGPGEQMNLAFIWYTPAVVGWGKLTAVVRDPSGVQLAQAEVSFEVISPPASVCNWFDFYSSYQELIDAAAAFGWTTDELMTRLCNSRYPGGWTRGAW